MLIRSPTLRPLENVWFRSFALSPWLHSSIEGWQTDLLHTAIRLDSILDRQPDRIWSDPDSIREVVVELINDCKQASAGESRIEFEIRCPDPRQEWIAFLIRDFAGGRPEDWKLPPGLASMARRLGGFIDVANEAGRKTTFSLHLPTGKIETWLRRNSQLKSVYLVRAESAQLGLATDRWLQRFLYFSGSYQPLDESSYLLARQAEFPADVRDPRVLAQRTPNAQDLRLSIERLGSMPELLHRLENTASPKGAARPTRESVPLGRLDSMTRIDVAHESIQHGPINASRLRPRRVQPQSVAKSR